MDAGEAVEQGEEVSARGAVFEAGDFAGTRHQTSLAEETLLHLEIFLCGGENRSDQGALWERRMLRIWSV